MGLPNVHNLKKQFKDQIIGFLEESDSFYWPKMHLWKGDNKFGQGPPPSFGQNPKEQHLFFVKPSLRGYDCKMSFILFEGCMWYILIYTSAHHFKIWNHIPGRRASEDLNCWKQAYSCFDLRSVYMPACPLRDSLIQLEKVFNI